MNGVIYNISAERRKQRILILRILKNQKKENKKGTTKRTTEERDPKEPPKRTRIRDDIRNIFAVSDNFGKKSRNVGIMMRILPIASNCKIGRQIMNRKGNINIHTFEVFAKFHGYLKKHIQRGNM